MERIAGWIKDNIWLVIILLIAAFGIGLYFQTQPTASKSKDMVSSRMNSLTKMEYTKYDGAVVSGGEVLDAADVFSEKPQFTVNIKTGNAPAGFYAFNKFSTCYTVPTSSGASVGTPGTCTSMVSTSQMRDSRNITNYVNPQGSFDSRVFKDASGEVRLIEFVQRP